MRDVIKFALKASVALFIIGVGTKLGKDALEALQDYQDNKNNVNDGQFE